MSDDVVRTLRRELKIARKEAASNGQLFSAALETCKQLHLRIDGLERNNQILMRSICPEGKCKLKDKEQ